MPYRDENRIKFLENRVEELCETNKDLLKKLSEKPKKPEMNTDDFVAFSLLSMASLSVLFLIIMYVMASIRSSNV